MTEEELKKLRNQLKQMVEYFSDKTPTFSHQALQAQGPHAAMLTIFYEEKELI